MLQADGTLAIPTAAVFEPLCVPSRYKGIHGGRGSGKSHFFSERIVEEAAVRPGLRVLCVREVQRSLKESAKRLIEDKIVAMERKLCERVDLVFCTARTLLERKGVYNPNTFLASHGVDHAHFAKALDEKTEIAEEIRHLPKPVFGFIGLVQDWVDVDFFAYLAERRPDWSVVVVGKSLVDLTKLKKYKNIHLLGRKPYESLASYCKGFDVSLIPFVLNELTRNVNPIKLREYLSAGLAVVSTDIPEVTMYANAANGSPGKLNGAVLVGKTHEELFAHCERALREDSPEARRARSEEMKKETWEVKVGELGDHVLRVREAKKR